MTRITLATLGFRKGQELSAEDTLFTLMLIIHQEGFPTDRLATIAAGEPL